MGFDRLYTKALQLEPLSVDEGYKLYTEASTPELIYVANELRKKQVPGDYVGWIIDRNVNITNVCISGCKFCNFHKKLKDPGTYTTNLEEYSEKIEEMLGLGGKQLLLQGGMHPSYGLEYYVQLFSELKTRYPEVKLHALGPPEIVHIARKERRSYREVLEILVEAGLDSLPGAGAEILSDRVRGSISPGKAKTDEWLQVMRAAHQLNITTSATMMFGHIETYRERIKHLVLLREVQDKKPDNSTGFTAFIPWPIIYNGTQLEKEVSLDPVLPTEYVRTIAISRIMLNNIKNIQASWLTVGKETAQLCLHAGANDFGSIMIEENVVSSAGASFRMDAEQMQKAIKEAGFKPQQRDQAYKKIEKRSKA
jgi:cyclic dehypoxanthinyl futalosine synthase